jgi:hypothetical protein
MDLMERPSMRRLVRDLKRHAPLLSLGVVAILVLVSTAVVIGASRQAPDRDAGLVALASASPRPSTTPSITPAPTPVPPTSTPVATRQPAPPTPEPTPAPTDEPTPDEGVDTDPIDVEDPGYYEGPTVEPEVSLQLGGQPGDAGFLIKTGDTAEEVLNLHTHDLVRSDCSLTQSYEPDDPRGTPWTVALEPLAEQTISMVDGLHIFVATCRTDAGEFGAGVRGVAMDRKPEACRDFDFERGEISVASRDELTAGIVGTWKGCVTGTAPTAPPRPRSSMAPT